MQAQSMRSRMNADCFFFQAEDGIRDYKVTGVQTCALPISQVSGARAHGGFQGLFYPVLGADDRQAGGEVRVPGQEGPVRSEERRVGKECRSRWSPYH